MKISNKLIIFGLILFVSLTAVSAADIIEDDSSAVAVETPQVEPTNTESNAPNVQETQQEDEVENTDPGANPSIFTSLSDGATYENAVITLGSDASYTDGSVNFLNNVTLTSDDTKKTLTNMKIVISGNNVTIDNVIFNHNTETTASITNYVYNNETEEYETVTTIEDILGTYSDTKVIDIIGGIDVTINDVEINLAKNQSFTTMGISATSVSHNIIINNSNINVQSAAQGQSWQQDASGNWYSTLAVSAVVFDNSNYIQLENSTVNIINTTSDLISYTTMPGVTVRNNANQITIKNNIITSAGARFVYGIMMNDLVNNVETINNTVTVSGLYYVAGIDASTASNSKTCKNNITAISENATIFTDKRESLAYGIVSDTYTSGNTANHICQNTINITANTCYGIEMYRGMNNFICTNNITTNGNKSMGVALAFSTNNKIINNNFTLIGTINGVYHPFDEDIKPVNNGIILANQSNGNWIQGNYINLTTIDDYSALAINITNDTANTVTENYVRVNYNADGTNNSVDPEEIILADPGNTVDYDDNEVVLYSCDCCCECTPQNPIEPIEEDDNFFAINLNKKTIKKDYVESETIIITDENIADYIRTQSKSSYTFGDKIKTTDNIVLKINSGTAHIAKFEINPHSIIVEGTIINQITTAKYTNATNIFAPNAYLSASDSVNVINCTVANMSAMRSTGLIENNTIINLQAPTGVNQRCNFAATTGTIRNNYLFFYVPTQNQYYIGLEGGNIASSTAIIENNGPTTGHLLSNTNYSTFFDENNIMKEEYTDSIIYAVENITSPVIVDKKVTLSAIRGHTGYDNVKFIEGSEESTIEDSLINNLELNKAFLVNVHNNKLIGENAQINLIETTNCIIENNVINTEKKYTITIDENSMDNTIKNNQLTAAQYTGDKSVQNTAENTIENNTPESIEPPATPELKVDTTEFTIGTTSTIKASICLDDEIASNITGGKVVFKVNGKTLKDTNGKVIYAKLTNGTATIEDYEIPETWNKEEITITAVYSGSKDCEALRSEVTELTITSEQSNPTINTEQTPTTATIGQTIQLKAKITDQANPITTGKVVFKVNGKTVKDANGKVIHANVDANGEVTVNYTVSDTLKAKDYNITITFTSAKYETITTNTTITITKA